MKVILLVTILCLTIIMPARAQKKAFNKALADSLNSWALLDQVAAKAPEGKYKAMGWEKFGQFQDSVFDAHQLLLSKVFDLYGYPGYDLVGQKGSNNFWLMVQHCDKHLAFQQKVLNAMKKELAKNNADSKNYAYLTDRVKINTRQKQVYGTQLTYNTDSCQAIPKPLADSLNVNQRRKEVGLEPIEKYLDSMSELHFMMNKATYEKKGITGPKLLTVPKENNSDKP